jgi:iron complex transport system substrate-binding protein
VGDIAPASIVSLIASATEILCSLGLRDRLVGVSHECDFPEDIKGLPVLSAPKVDPALPAGEIDRRVRAIVAEGLSVYRIRTEELARVRPDLIVTQDQCEVCAVSLKDVEEAVSALTLKATRVCSLRPNTLEDIVEDFRRVAAAAGVTERGEVLVEWFSERLANVRERTSRAARRPTVACLEWLDPVMVAGGWMPELVRIAGGEPLLVTEVERFRKVEWDRLAEADPDVIVVMPCGFTIDRTLAELGDTRTAETLRGMRATREGRCFLADGNAYFNRPGPRIADSAEILAVLLRQEILGETLGARRWPAG